MKVTLPSTGKVVILREYKIKHRELAIRAVGNRSGDNQFLFGELIQKEMAKILIETIDAKKLSANELEDMDSLFNPVEFSELGKAIGQVMGGNALSGEPVIEFVASGE